MNDKNPPPPERRTSPAGDPMPETHPSASPDRPQLPMPEVTTALASVEELTPASHGIWLILTHHTVHVLDLDLHLYERRPGPDASRFPFDFTPVRYSRIEQAARRGARMLVWFDDPDLPDLQEHYRYTSTIRAIIGWAGNTTAPVNVIADDVTAANTNRASEHTDRSHRGSTSDTSMPEERRRIGDRGSWRVETVNSDYVIDLDAGTATRNPLEPWPLRGDGDPIPLVEVICAEVGLPLILRLRHQRSAVETVRYGTTVLRIQRS